MQIQKTVQLPIVYVNSVYQSVFCWFLAPLKTDRCIAHTPVARWLIGNCAIALSERSAKPAHVVVISYRAAPYSKNGTRCLGAIDQRSIVIQVGNTRIAEPISVQISAARCRGDLAVCRKPTRGATLRQAAAWTDRRTVRSWASFSAAAVAIARAGAVAAAGCWPLSATQSPTNAVFRRTTDE